MECRQVRKLLSAHIDRELGVPDAIEIDEHLQTCPACRDEHARQAALRAAIRKQAVYFAAPGYLENRIKAALPAQTQSPVQPVKRSSWNWLSLGTALASLTAVAWSLGLYLMQPSESERLSDEVVSSHVRSLMSNRIADVASSDQHTVKPWFSGKLDFSPAVSDLTAEGYPLVGGRLDYLDHRPVAVLVYRHRQHFINVYVWPTAAGQQIPVQTLSRQGFHLVHWAGAGMTYWGISDLDQRELMALVDILQTRTVPQ